VRLQSGGAVSGFWKDEGAIQGDLVIAAAVVIAACALGIAPRDLSPISDRKFKMRSKSLGEVALSIYSLVCGWPVVILLTLFGIAACLLVVTIPFGIGALQLAGYLAWPFGRSVERELTAENKWSVFKGLAYKPGLIIGGVIWALLFSWLVFLSQVLTMIILCFTIVGIPLAIAYFHTVPFATWPLNARIVRSDNLRFSDFW
jgi:uncharacterized membrane protein YccF (DUF307 family)